MLNSASENCYIAGTKVLPEQAEIIGKEERQSKQKVCSVGWRVKQEGRRKRKKEQRLREQLLVLTIFHAYAHQVQKRFL